MDGSFLPLGERAAHYRNQGEQPPTPRTDYHDGSLRIAASGAHDPLPGGNEPPAGKMRRPQLSDYCSGRKGGQRRFLTRPGPADLLPFQSTRLEPKIRSVSSLSGLRPTTSGGPHGYHFSVSWDGPGRHLHLAASTEATLVAECENLSNSAKRRADDSCAFARSTNNGLFVPPISGGEDHHSGMDGERGSPARGSLEPGSFKFTKTKFPVLPEARRRGRSTPVSLLEPVLPYGSRVSESMLVDSPPPASGGSGIDEGPRLERLAPVRRNWRTLKQFQGTIEDSLRASGESLSDDDIIRPIPSGPRKKALLSFHERMKEMVGDALIKLSPAEALAEHARKEHNRRGYQIRKQFRAQSDERPVSDDESVNPLDAIPEITPQQLRDRFNHRYTTTLEHAVSSFLPMESYACTRVNVETRHVVMEVINRLVAFLTILSGSKTWSDVIVNFMASLALMVDRETLAMLETFIGGDSTAQQSGMDFRETMLQLKKGLKDPESLPIYDTLKKCFMVATLLGLRQGDEMRDSGCLADVFRAWNRQALKMSKVDLVDVAIDIALFTHEIVVLLEAGSPITHLLMPRTIATRVAELEALLPRFKAGNLNKEDDGYDMEDYRSTVISLKCHASTAAAQSTGRPFAEREAADRVLQHALKLYSTVKTYGQNLEPREAAFGVMFYGETSVGKTTAMYTTCSYLGSLCGFPADPKRNFYNKTQKDSFDSGLTKATNILAFDDAGNAQEGHLMEEVIEEMSNVSKFSNQADLDLKGVIPYKYDMGVGTTNHWDARIKKVSTAPGSILRRFVWLDTTCPNSPNGRFDKDQVYDSDGNYNDQHVVQEYTFAFESTTSNNYVRQNIGEPMPLTEWLVKRGGPLCKAWRAGQETYLKVVGNTHIFHACSHGLVTAMCPTCRPNPKLEQQLSVTIPAWAATACHTCADLTMPVVEAVILPFPKYITDSLTVYAWRVIMCGARRAWGALMIHTIPILIVWHGGVALLLLRPKYWFIGLFFVVQVLAYKVWAFRQACRSYVAFSIEQSLRGPRALYAAYVLGQLGFLYALSRRMLEHATSAQSLVATPEAQQARCKETNYWLPSIEKSAFVNVTGKVRTMTEEQVISLVQKCVGRLYYLYGGVEVGTSYTRISPRELLVPAHFAVRLETEARDTRVTVQRSNSHSIMIPYKAVVEEFRYHEVADLCIMVMSEGPPGPHIRDLIVDEMPQRSVAATLVRCSRDGEKTRTLYADCNPVRASSDTSLGLPPAPGVMYQFVGNDCTVAGDCGSPLISHDYPHVILGFHVGGGSTHGLAHCGPLRQFNSSKPAAFGRISKQSFEPLPIADFMETENVEGLTVMPHPEADPGPRNPMRYIAEGSEAPHAFVAGAQVTPRAPKSEVTTTVLSPYLETEGIPCKFERPRINANRDGAAYLQYSLSPMSPIAPSLLRRCVDEYVSHGIKGMAQYTPGPLHRDIETALNGIRGDKFSKPMKISTAAGVYLPGKKEKYVEVNEMDDGSRWITPTDLLRSRVETMHDRYLRGYQSSPITRAACKDEPVMKEEYAGKKKIVRQFMVCPFEFLIVGRMLLAELVKALLLHPFVFGMVQGTNTITEDWTELQGFFLDDFENIIEGDYSKYDVRMNGQMIRAVGAIFARFAVHFGAEHWHVRAIRTYFEDLAAKHISIAGVFVGISGWNVSGHGVTIEANGVVNKLLYMCAYYYTVESLQFTGAPKFDQAVTMMFMGDDSVGKSRVSWFNMHSMQIFCKDHNMPYTLGTKGEISAETPFLEDGRQASFCKRKWRWVERRRLYDCPLDLDSILKPLHVRMRNKDLSDPQYLKSQLTPTLIELARHPQEVFDTIVGQLGRAFLNAGMWFEELELSYSDMQHKNDGYYTAESQCKFDPISGTVSPNSAISPLSGIPEDFSVQCYSEAAVNTADPRFVAKADDSTPTGIWFTSQSEASSGEALPVGGRGGPPLPPARREFGFDLDRGRRGPGTTEDNISFHASETQGHGMANLGIGSAVQGTDSLSNTELMSREVKIATIEWRHNADLFTQINPWRLLFEDRVIANRLAHFRLLHCMGLEVRFALAGNPMMMGRALCSYLPLHTIDGTTLHRSGNRADMVEASQRPHVTLDPSLSTGGTIMIPYNYPVPFFDIVERDWSDAGIITIQTLNRLDHATGQTNSAYINVFVRALSPSVSVGTSQLGFTRPQMERMTDPAVGDMKELVHPLSLKREKAVSRGSEDVELSNLAQRKTYLTTFEWRESVAPGAHLFSVEVTPQLYVRSGSEIHMTPSCWTTNPFEYWRSDMEYTFEVVASGLHRGKLLIRWDPLGFDDARKDDFHITQTAEFDLTERSRMSFKVGWGSPFPYIETGGRNLFDQDCMGPQVGRVPRPHCNGTVSVYVLNNLTVPNESGPSALNVNVYAAAGPNYEVVSLTPRLMRCLKNSRSSNSSSNPTPNPQDPPTDGGHQNITTPPQEKPPAGTVDTDPPSNVDIDSDIIPTFLTPEPGIILRQGSILNGLVSNHREGAGATGILWYYFDGSNDPTIEYRVSKGTNDWTQPGTFSTPAGAVNYTATEVNSGFVLKAPLPRPSGDTAGWYATTYTNTVQNNREFVWIRCAKMNFPPSQGLFTIDSDQPGWGENVGDGFFGKTYSPKTVVTLGNKVGNTPVTILAKAGAVVEFNGEDGSLRTETFQTTEARTFIIWGNTPRLEGQFVSITYVYQTSAQSEEVAPSGNSGEEATETSADVTLGTTRMPSRELMIAAGEAITDWYSVLNRYTATYSIKGNRTSVSVVFPQYPVEKFSSREAHVTFVRNGLFEYISRAYLGVRGSMNMKIARDPRSVGELRHRSFTVDRLPTTQQIMGFSGDTKAVTPFLLSGTAWCNDITQGGMDVNIPHYSNFRYYASRALGMRGLGSLHAPSNVWMRGWLDRTESLIISYSQGNDFSLESFVSTPVMEPC